MTGRRLTGIALFVLALAAVTVAVARFGRQESPAPTAMEGMARQKPGTLQPVHLTAREQQRIGVTFAPVTEGMIARTVRVVGLLSFDETRIRTVTARVDGYVERLEADFTGRYVGTGEPLLSLYSPMVVAAQEELLLARELLQSLAPADAEPRAAAERALEGARRRLRLWNIPEETITSLEQTGTSSRLVQLRSPYSGFVIEKNVTQGQRVMAGDPLFRLADLGLVWFEGEVFEQDLALVRVGARALVTFQALPGVERIGRITYIYPTLDPTTRTAKVRVELSNADLALKPGMYGLLQFDGVAGSGLTIPRSAVLSTGTRHLVFVKQREGPLEPREVVIGISTPDRIQVLRGLVAGDTVVATATFLLDAESNLNTLLGGMGGMPGMDMAPVKKPGPASSESPHEGHQRRPD